MCHASNPFVALRLVVVAGLLAHRARLPVQTSRAEGIAHQDDSSDQCPACSGKIYTWDMLQRVEYHQYAKDDLKDAQQYAGP